MIHIWGFPNKHNQIEQCDLWFDFVIQSHDGLDQKSQNWKKRIHKNITLHDDDKI
jgi:hypothetical protein